MKIQQEAEAAVTAVPGRPAEDAPTGRVPGAREDGSTAADCRHTLMGFPIVCVGGSAGGLDAYVRLLRHLPNDMDAAVIIVNHLRTVETHLHRILPLHTGMPVRIISDGLVVRPNQVFIIPPNRDLHVAQGTFQLRPLSKPRGWPDVITVCLLSLARHWKGQLIAVIVSGLDGDGADAMCCIRDLGGLTIAQEPDTAGQPGMPTSAIASGCIDFVLAPEDIGRKIASLCKTGGRDGAPSRKEKLP